MSAGHPQARSEFVIAILAPVEPLKNLSSYCGERSNSLSLSLQRTSIIFLDSLKVGVSSR